MLHVIANPRDGVALATVLRSRLVAVNDEALLRARHAGEFVDVRLIAGYEAQLQFRIRTTPRSSSGLWAI